MSEIIIPEGFEPFPLDNSFNDAFAPLYISMTDDGPKVALCVQKHHLNPMGICHGAVYMALLDIAFASVIGHAMGKYAGTPTININIDYMSSTGEGEWLFTDVSCLKLTNSMGFTQGIVRGDKGIKVSGNGVFKLPADIDAAPGVTVEELKNLRSS